MQLSTACRHPAMALAIATANFPHEPVAGAIVLYLLVATLVSLPYVLWHKRGPVLA